MLKTGLHCLPLLFLLLFHRVHAHTPPPCLKESKYLVGRPVLSLHEKSTEDSPFVTQTVYGHQVYLVENVGHGWALMETEDGYRGYAKIEGILPDNPRWRGGRHLCRTKSVAGQVYSVPDTEKPALLRLPFDSRILLVRDLAGSDDRWLEVILIGGEAGWIQRGDVEKVTTKSVEEVVALSRQFCQLPYIWGGTSSEGFDCSGYVQTLLKQTGAVLPRNSGEQATSDKVDTVNHPEFPGDLLFFGHDRITHVGLYLGNDRFIHSSVWNHKPKVAITGMDVIAKPLLATRRLKEGAYAYRASIHPIDEHMRARPTRFRKGEHIAESLRYVRLSHRGFDGYVHTGESFVHKEVAREITEIFEELFASEYPIEKMLPVNDYGTNDILSYEDNNSSVSYPQRTDHGLDLAVDVNPLFNPHRRGHVTIPENGREFIDRTLPCRGIITRDDPCYRAFVSRGWRWGGDLPDERGNVAWQRFYKTVRTENGKEG
ncbi:MAG: NlpC/P60 family protein [Simkaniaceae bacterium]|nr:NlpC/P60 family protein [Simkaniaceae bacterium]